MPIINRQDAQEVDQYIARFFAPPSGGRAQALRRLFVEKLDFASATGAVSLAKAPKNVALPLTAERIASIEGLNVVYVPLSGDGPDRHRVRKAEAAAAAKLIADALHGDLLLVMTNPSCSQLHIIYPTFVGVAPSLRRMIIERDLPRRTAVQQLSNIYWHWKDSGSIGTAVDRAFDVDAVTKLFFEEYQRVFESVMASVKEGFGPGEQEAKKLFVQTVFNRLMFIYFVSRKGWLKFKGDPDYLNVLRKDYRAQPRKEDFYQSRLQNLFFVGLNNPQSMDLRTNNPALYALIGDVRFLNGGLFEETENDKRPGITVPDEAVDQILHELFDRFNFTVIESTPFDVEVAVDPEMLGKVFEERVTGRHESGSYYTPRPVVAFMCREALKGYLETQNTEASAEAIAAFVDHKDKREERITGTGGKDKAAVVGLLERHGEGKNSRVRTEVIPNTRRKTLSPIVREHVTEGSAVFTDALKSYDDLGDTYTHQVIDHAEAYVRGRVHTNGIENFWSLLKRAIRGTYVNVEPFHLFRYLDEETFRYNTRKANDGSRFQKVVGSVSGKRLTYQKLIGAPTTPA